MTLFAFGALGASFAPWAYWRTVTLILAAIWTAEGLGRLFLFHRRWERRLLEFGASRPWLRRQLRILVLRVTVLDPWNLALLLALLAMWSVAWLVSR